MNKKRYQEPAMQVVSIKTSYQLLAGSAKNVAGNANLNYGGGGSGAAYSRDGGDWDDED